MPFHTISIFYMHKILLSWISLFGLCVLLLVYCWYQLIMVGDIFSKFSGFLFYRS